MNYKDIKYMFKDIENKGYYQELIKAILSYELNIDNEETLDRYYNYYLTNDYLTLLNEYFYKKEK